MGPWSAGAGKSVKPRPGLQSIASVAANPTLLRGGIWSELAATPVAIDAFRRELQRSYLAAVRAKVTPSVQPTPAGLPPQAQQVGPARATSDVRSALRSELRALDAAIQRALPRAADRMTRAHLEDARDQIRDILEPERR